MKGLDDGLPVAVVIQLRQARGKQVAPLMKEIRMMQICRAVMKRMKECARQGGKDRRPAEQAEQRI